jgi:pyrroloquinoline-quinone synthase
MSRAPRVSATASAVLQRVGILNNPYFTSLKDGSMPLANFRATQEQFYFAVQYYPRPIAALISRIADSGDRMDLVHNLVEEHGSFRPDHFHQNTFRQFLASIGGTSPDLAGVPIGPSVHAFNCTLGGVCCGDEPDAGICCLGIIEQAFAGISALIGTAVVQRGWVERSALVHYALHAELDVRHAEELFAMSEKRMDDASGQATILRGLELGAYAFDQLYSNLFNQQGQRHG